MPWVLLWAAGNPYRNVQICYKERILHPSHLEGAGGMLGLVCNSVLLKANMNRTSPVLYASLMMYLFSTYTVIQGLLWGKNH
jgi:hypothetical protein